MDVKRGPIEVALTTDLRGAPYSFSLWDIHTGTQLVAFKGNKACPISKCLQLIDNNYFITAADNVLQIWSIYNRKCQDQKLFLPSRPSALCISPCGRYLIAGISDMIYIWQFSSGDLLAHMQRHYQIITVLKMNHKGTFFFSGGEDGMVLVWPFADLISGTHNTRRLSLSKSRTDTGVNEPKFTWQHHSASITDIHVTSSDCDLCVTTSADKTVNIYSQSEGQRLHCIADWPTPLCCVVMDKNCNRIFFGGQDGNIYELSISALGTALMESRGKDDEGSRIPTFRGHKDRVDQLLISLDGSMLISGSRDSTCKTWDIPTGKMIRDVKHQAPLANLTSILVPDALSLTSMTQSNSKPPLLVKPLKRNLRKMSRDMQITATEIFEESSTTIVTRRKQGDMGRRAQRNVSVGATTGSEPQGSLAMKEDGFRTDVPPGSKNDETDAKNIKARLRDLYLLSVEKLFKNAAAECLKPYRELVAEINENGVEPRPPKRKSKTSEGESERVVNGVKKIKSIDGIIV